MNPPAPRVSVILNTFNSTRYLSETLASLFAQTWRDWELIVWDNCSEDDTLRLVREQADERVRIFVAPRRMTLAEGRNEAMARARGGWLAFLDHDDLWLPHKLAAQLRRAEEAPEPGRVGLVYARTRSFSARGDEGEMVYRYAGRPLPEGRILRQLLLEGCIVPMVAGMISAEAVRAVGPIPAHYRFAEDYWLFAAVAERFETRCVQEVCCRYRVHSESATARSRSLSHQEALTVLETFRHHLPPADYRSRRRQLQSLWAAEMICREGRPVAGLGRLLREGSPGFFLAGSFRHLWRRWVRGRRPVS